MTEYNDDFDDFPMADDEEYYNFEEQDLRILKALTTDKLIAIRFTNSYDHNIFFDDAKDVGKAIIDYINSYKAIPTKRVLLDLYKNEPLLLGKIESAWEHINNIEFNESEFEYDLDKLKNRFTKHKLVSLRDSIDELNFPEANYEEELKKIQRQIDEANIVRRGSKQAYTQQTLKNYMPEFKRTFRAKVEDKTLGRGIMTGYSFLDYVKNGMSPAEMLIIGGETGGGKMLTLDTLIPTPTGFKKNKDLRIGDKVFGRDGEAYNIVAESKIELVEGWKFIFNDGSEVISHDNHEWLTFDRKEQVALSKRTPEYRAKRKAKRKSRAIKNTKPWLTKANKNRKYDLLPPPTGTIRTSKEIAETLFVHKNKRRNHAIPIANAVELPEKDLLIDPYLFGCWLGDGSSNDGAITSMDDEIINFFIKENFSIKSKRAKYDKNGHINKASIFRFNKLTNMLRKLGVFGNKHIPHDYLWASKEQRLALLQGLMDTDGFVSTRGQINFVNTNEKIANGVAHLVRSLGEKCTITKGEARLYGRVTGPKWTVRFAPSFDTFRLKRKLKRQVSSPRLNKFRYIVEAIRVTAVPMKCIQVDSPDHLYLCTENFIPTHNSMLLNNMAIQMWMQANAIDTPTNQFVKGHNVLYFSLEMPYDACARRTLARISDLPIYSLRDCSLNKEQAKQLGRAVDFIGRYPFEFEIVDIPRGVTIEQIELRFNEALSKYFPEIVVVDYLGLMDTSGNDSSDQDWLRLGHIAGRLHEFARAYNVVMLTAVQLNRAANKSSQNSSELIGMHRIGRSSLIMHHANIGIQIESRKNERLMDDLVYHIIKNRDGEHGSHRLKKKFQNASLTDIEKYIPPTGEIIDAFGPTALQEDLTEFMDEEGW